MSTQAIRTIITTQIDFPIMNAKNKLREEGKKKVDKLKSKLPTIEELKEQFISDNCELGAQEKLQKQFDNFKEKIDTIMKAIDAAIKLLDSLKEKLNKIINEIIPKIKSILDTLEPIVTALNLILKVIPRIALGIPTSVPGVSAGIILTLENTLKTAKALAGEFLALIASVRLMFSIYERKIRKITDPLNQAVTSLTKFSEFVKQRLGVLDMLLLMYLSKCNVGNQDPIDPSTGNVNTNLLNPDLNTLTELYGDLIGGVSDNKAIERIKNIKFGFQTSYKVINT